MTQPDPHASAGPFHPDGFREDAVRTGAMMSPEEAHEAILKGTCPPGVSVHGSLAFLNEPSLAELPRGLAVEEGLDILGCHRLRRLPAGLSARSVSVSHCDAFEGFDVHAFDRFFVPGHLVLLDCPSLTAWPRELYVGGQLRVARCQWAWDRPALPRGAGAPFRLSVGGQADLEECAGLRELPREVEVGTSLTLSRCPRMTALPGARGGRLVVGDLCVVERCHGLRELSRVSFRGEGKLRVRDCAALEVVGDGARPGATLALADCPSLSRLPSPLPPSCRLAVRNCPKLQADGEAKAAQGHARQAGAGPRAPSPAP